MNRRRFLKTAATVAVAPNIIRAAAWAEPPSRTLNLGFVGVGIMSRGHLGFFLGQTDCRVLGIAEVAQPRREAAMDMVQKKYGDLKSCQAYTDFRKLIANKDIDAVVVGTPDHWHATVSIAAAEAKKDVYCEKPLTVTVAAALAVVQAARKHDIVFQTGSQQRTEFGGKFRTAVELVRNGRLGKIKRVLVGVGGPAKPCDLIAEPTPAGFEWDMWLGAAPVRAFNHVLCPLAVHNHFPAWRAYREYAGGGLSDMGAHHFDIAQWALDKDESGPVEIIPPADNAQTGLKFVYADGIEVIHGGPSGCTFEGADGTLYVDRNKIESTPARILTDPQEKTAFRLPEIGTSHRRNWLDCIRSRKRPVADVAKGAHTSILCSLGNLGYQLGRRLKWDPKTYTFANDTEANGLLNRPGRGEWKWV